MCELLGLHVKVCVCVAGGGGGVQGQGGPAVGPMLKNKAYIVGQKGGGGDSR